MAKHSATSEHTFGVRTAIGGALTAGALLTAPVVVPAIAGVAVAEPTPSQTDTEPAPTLKDTLNALQSAVADHQGRVADANAEIRAGLTALNPSQVQSGLGKISTSRETMRVQVQGIVRGAFGGS